MMNPKLRHLPDGTRAPSGLLFTDKKTMGSSSSFAKASAGDAEKLCAELGPHWVTQLPLLNPIKIIEEIDVSPMTAAGWCHNACSLLGRGYHQRVKNYLIAAYMIACAFRGSPEQIANLSSVITDDRCKSKVKLEKVKPNLLHYVFIYIFFQSGLTMRDRATQYAQGLQPYFDAGTPPAEVELKLYQHGPDRLRRAALQRTKLIRGAQEWANNGKDPVAAGMDEVLTALAASDSNRKGDSLDTDVTDPGTYDLPTDEGRSVEPDIDRILSAANTQAVDAAQSTSTDNTRKSQDGYSAEEEKVDNEPTEISRSERHTINADLSKILLRMMDLGASMSERSFDINEQRRLQTDIVNLGMELNKVRRSLIQAD